MMLKLLYRNFFSFSGGRHSGIKIHIFFTQLPHVRNTTIIPLEHNIHIIGTQPSHLKNTTITDYGKYTVWLESRPCVNVVGCDSCVPRRRSECLPPIQGQNNKKGKEVIIT